MGGLGHDMKVGVNFINEPRLYITFNTGTNDYTYTHLDNNINGPISLITRNGGAAAANIPLKQYAGYIQDDWRVTDRLTLNLGLRYDLITGLQVDQSKNPNFVKVQAAGRAGLLSGLKGMENFGQDPKDDTNNIQPRLGFAYDLRGDGKRPHPRRLGHLPGRRLHELQRPLRRHRCHRHRLGLDLQRRRAGGHPESRWQLLPDRPADRQHRQPEPGQRVVAAAHRAVPRPAPADALHAPGLTRLVAPVHLEHGVQRRSSSATTAAT